MNIFYFTFTCTLLCVCVRFFVPLSKWTWTTTSNSWKFSIHFLVASERALLSCARVPSLYRRQSLFACLGRKSLSNATTTTTTQSVDFFFFVVHDYYSQMCGMRAVRNAPLAIRRRRRRRVKVELCALCRLMGARAPSERERENSLSHTIAHSSSRKLTATPPSPPASTRPQF